MPATVRPHRFAFIGGFNFAKDPLRALTAFCHGHGHRLVTVVAQPVKDKAKPGKLRESPTTKEAKRLGLPLHICESLKRVEAGKGTAVDRVAYDLLAGVDPDSKPDFVITAGTGLMIPPGLIARTKFVNLHPSLLPAYRGAAPIQRAIAQGESETGVTVHFIDEGTDTGPILGQAKTKIDAHDTADDVMRRCMDMGTDLLLDVLAKLVDGTAKATPQLAEDPFNRLAPPILYGDRRLRWSILTAEEAVNRIRGFSGHGEGCFSRLGERFKFMVKSASLVSLRGVEFSPRTMPAGTVVDLDPLSGITVLARDLRPVLLRRLAYGSRDEREKPEPPLGRILMESGVQIGDRLS